MYLLPPPPFLNLLSPWPHCLSISTDYWWYWLSSTDCLKLFPQTHTWGSALATGGPSAQHCSYSADSLYCWHPQHCQPAQTPTPVCLSVWDPFVALQSCSDVWLEPLPPVFNMDQESCITSHILVISPSCWPAQTSVLISMPNNLSQPCWSHQPNTLTQEIPPPKKKTCSDSCLSPHLALPTCSHTQPESSTKQ